MARQVRDLAAAAGAPLGVVLEGGYNQRVLAEGVRETLVALTSEEPARSAPERSTAGQQLTERAAAQVGHYWPL